MGEVSVPAGGVESGHNGQHNHDKGCHTRPACRCLTSVPKSTPHFGEFPKVRLPKNSAG